MQKKICLWIIAYMVVLSLVGMGFFVKNSLHKLPLMEEAIIRDLMVAPEVTATEHEEITPSETAAAESGTNVIPNQKSTDYWAGYRESKAAQVSTTDKMKVFLLVKKNLSTQEMNRIFSLAQGGMTPAEQGEIKDLLRSRLNEADRSELKELLVKYF